MKKLISMIAVIAFLLSAVCFGASAEAATVYDALVEGISSFTEEIEIYQMQITCEELKTYVEEVVYNEPLLFNFTGSYEVYYDPRSGLAVSVVPKYTMTEAQYGDALDFVNGEIKKIISLIPEGLDDYEKALFLHDYLLVNFEYDTDYKISDIYNMLKEGECVCMGYTLLYDALLTEIGIESSAVLSPETSLNHVWNEVKIDGKWYHVDVTWDDPVADVFGRACHLNFLICDSCVSDSHHDCVYYAHNECSSTEYETVDWRRIDSPFAFVGDKVYALDNNELVEFNLNDEEVTTVKILLNKGWFSPQGAPLGYCSGFGGYGEMLYYNTPDSIMCYNPATDTSSAVRTVEEGYIVGMYMNGDEVHYLLSATGHREDGTEYVFKLGDAPENNESNPDESNPDESNPDESNPDESNPDESNPDESNPDESNPDNTSVGGDANGDGKLDTYDYIYVKRIYFKTLTVSEKDMVRADVNKDSQIDAYDYILVRRAYFGTYVFE